MILSQASTKTKQFSIYDGLLSKKINLAAIRSSKVIVPSQVVQKIDNDAKINALKYRYPLKYLGKGYQQIVMPCTPAYELQICSNSQQQKQNYLFFAKVPNNTNVTGIASGKRSAIYLDQKKDRLIRLKGCGNQYKGFNKQNNQSRGHHFYHTAKRQLFMTQYINKVFQKELNLYPPANKPLYMYQYPENQLNSVNLPNDLPLISKYCCAFETQGDRRAGTHLISPLQILFLALIDHEKAQWKKSFIEKQRIDNGELVELVANFQLFLEQKQKFMNVYDSSTQIKNYIQFNDAKLQPIQQYKQKISQIFNKLVPIQYLDEGLSSLFSVDANKFKDLVEIILKKIGYQMGQIKRVMCQYQISWGFYLDHGVQWHCNAHLNNFVVTKPKADSNFFLRPLDYDLAYTSKQFINIDLQSNSYGQYSQDVFQTNLCGQFSAMQMSLFGLQMMNFKYGIQQFEKNQDMRMGRIAFRDTLVKAFNSGMRKKQEQKQKIDKQWQANVENIQKLVKACLYLSINFQT